MAKPAVRVTGLVFVAVVLATAGAAPAGDGIVPPLPEAMPGHPLAGIVEAAPDTGIAGPAESMATAETAGGGSRLLRALAEGSERADVPRDDAAPVFMAEGCPRALLRRLLASAASEADALSALGIEREVLTLCRERQEIVTALFETEARLLALRAPAEAPAPASSVPSAAAAPAAARARAVRMAPSIESAAPSPLRAALAGAAGTPADAEPEPRYGWFSIIGSAGALRAGVTDGSGVWFVREGDPLPGGARIAAIAGRPPGVRVSGQGESAGEETPLPWRARPGGTP